MEITNLELHAAAHLDLDEEARESARDGLIRQLFSFNKKMPEKYIDRVLSKAIKSSQPEWLVEMIWLRQYQMSGALKTDMLEVAFKHGFSNIEACIIANDARQIFAVDENGLNALTRCAYHGMRARLETYLGALAPSTWTSMPERQGKYNLLHLCANQDWEDLTRRLLGTTPLKDVQSDHRRRTLLHWAIEHAWNHDAIDIHSKPLSWLDQQDENRETAMHLAIVHRDRARLDALLVCGADIMLKNQQGLSPVHLAAKLGYTAALDAFLHTETADFGKGQGLVSLLHFMSMWEHQPVIERYLTTRRPDVNARTVSKQTPLHYAAIHGNSAAAALLLEHGADVRAVDGGGNMPLHFAVREGHSSMSSLLLDFGAPIQALDGHKQTCLQLAIRTNNERLVAQILGLQRVVDHQDTLGKTALHRACATGNPTIMRQVLDLGADCNTKDHLLQTPLHVVTVSGNVRAVRVLLEHENSSKLRVNELDHKTRRPLDRALHDRKGLVIVALQEHGAICSQDWHLKFGAEFPYVYKTQGEELNMKWPVVPYVGVDTSWAQYEMDFASRQYYYLADLYEREHLPVYLTQMQHWSKQYYYRASLAQRGNVTSQSGGASSTRRTVSSGERTPRKETGVSDHAKGKRRVRRKTERSGADLPVRLSKPRQSASSEG
ncbi:MAG: hypothetical protein Q9162_001267 [Coniocarpon cinnabarinum]